MILHSNLSYSGTQTFPVGSVSSTLPAGFVAWSRGRNGFDLLVLGLGGM